MHMSDRGAKNLLNHMLGEGSLFISVAADRTLSVVRPDLANKFGEDTIIN